VHKPYTLLISGGALRGPFSVPIIEHLWALYGPPSAVGGTSIGALHAFALSSGDPSVLRAMWSGVHKRSEMIHAPLDLFHGGLRDGIFSMARARKILERADLGKHRTIPVHVGVTDAVTGCVRQVDVGADVPYAHALDSVFASASLSPAMEIVHYWWRGKRRVGYDGGLFEVLPRLRVPPLRGEKVVAIFHSPITAQARDHKADQESVSASWGMAMLQLDHVTDRSVLERDVPYLRALRERGVSVDAYAPETWEDVGPSWEYTDDLREHRYAAGRRAVLRGPVSLA